MLFRYRIFYYRPQAWPCTFLGRRMRQCGFNLPMADSKARSSKMCGQLKDMVEAFTTALELQRSLFRSLERKQEGNSAIKKVWRFLYGWLETCHVEGKD